MKYRKTYKSTITESIFSCSSQFPTTFLEPKNTPLKPNQSSTPQLNSTHHPNITQPTTTTIIIPFHFKKL